MNSAVLVRLVLLGMIWGASFLFQRIAVPVVGAGMTAAARMIFAALTLSIVLALMRKSLQWRRRWKDYLLIGTTVAGVPFLCFAYGAYSLPAGYLAVLNATTPLFTVLLVSLAGTRASASKWVGVVVGIVGVFTLARFGTVGMNLQTALGFAAVLVASLLYAYSARAIQLRFADVDPLVVATGNMIGGTLPLLPVAIYTFPRQMPSLGVLGCLLALGVICTALAYALHFRNIREAGSERAVTVTFFVPLFAQLWGALFLGESVTWASATGCALVLLAVAFIFEQVPGFARRSRPVVLAPKLCENKAA
ncbi:MAG TPA: DMT family transporter [Rudaea sp.]|uniref:DMT family transporter n=1 Tax=Rudaea sp. TaxID=2136325 RepID=UPI002F952FB3